MKQPSAQHNRTKIPKFNSNKARKMLTDREKNKLKNIKYAGNGSIGTIRTRKSGKKELVINGTVLDLTRVPLMCQTTMLEVVVKNNEKNEPKGTIHIFGDIEPNHSFIGEYNIDDLSK